MRTVVAALLRRRDFDVATAATGEEAVAQALGARCDEPPFDVVLLDLRMPVLSGEAAVGQLRAAGYAGAVVAMSGEPREDAERRVRAAGFDAYLGKPIEPEELFRVLLRG